MNELTEKELQVFTSKSQADKALNSLKGILIGIKLDNQINEKEISELKQWCKNHKELAIRNPFKDFMRNIDYTISSNIPLDETIEDLLWLCEKYEKDNLYYDQITADLQILQGICHGILSDGHITEDEVINLHQWLENNYHLNSYYPYDEIRSLLVSILSDGVIEESEIITLKAFLNQFVQIQDKEIAKNIKNEISDINISAHCSTNPDIVLDGKTFCITGTLTTGTKANLEEKIDELGGISTKSVTQKTDYLIVADNGNKAWTFACYGRKVEKALSLRKKGNKITLIHESDFYNIIESLII